MGNYGYNGAAGIGGWVRQQALRWRVAPVALWLLLINVAVYLLALVLRLILPFDLSGSDGTSVLFPLLSLPASLPRLLFRPWTLLTYMFYHEDFMHILLNMLWFWIFASLFLERYTPRQLVRVYLLGGLSGGLLYILAFNLLPFFHPILSQSSALGASASIMGITLAAALSAPNRTIYLYGLIPLRMLTMVLIVVGIDLLSILGSNAGGHIAHLGGATLGFLFYRRYGKAGRHRGHGAWSARGFNEEWSRRANRGNGQGFSWDALRGHLAEWGQGLQEKLRGLRSTQASRKGVSGKRGTSHRAYGWTQTPPRDQRASTNGSGSTSGGQDQAHIARVLEKLRQGGYSALTPEEKDLLFKNRRG